MAEDDDASLIASVAKGDKTAMRRLYERHGPAAQGFIRARLDDPVEAADIVQEVMLEVWRTAGRFAGDSAVRSWIFSIARNKTVDRLRRRSRESPVDPAVIPETPDTAPDAETVIAAAQLSERVRACLEGLSGAHKSALRLTFFEDLTYPEVAEIEGVSSGTIKSRIHHAKKLMMHCLGRL